MSRLPVSGDADATSGLFELSPRYVLRRSGRHASSSLVAGRRLVGLVLDLGQLLVDEPALVDVVLREHAEPLGLLGP